ncbi:9991_t:CDS:1, partial [Entrophospora sp. SA101]
TCKAIAIFGDENTIPKPAPLITMTPLYQEQNVNTSIYKAVNIAILLDIYTSTKRYNFV